jgi:hypothetical protein
MPDESSRNAPPALTIAGKRVISVRRWYNRTWVRSIVFLGALLVLALHLVMRSSVTLNALRLTGALVVLFAVWPLLIGTYLLHQNRTASKRAGYKVVDSLRLGELWVHRATELAQMGFKFVACLEKTPDHPRVTTLLALFVHPEYGDSAQLAKVDSSLRTNHLVVFNTRFDDGVVLETSDRHRARIFRRKARFPTFRFPQVRNLENLYQLHRALKHEFTASHRPVAATPEFAATAFIDTAEEVHSLNMRQGDYKLDPSGEHYVCTWKGAFRHSLLQTWPIAPIRQILAASDADKVCERLGFQIDPKLGRIEPIKSGAQRRATPD